MNKNYPWNHMRFGKKREEPVKCVYAGPEYFEKRNQSEMEGVYAGPELISGGPIAPPPAAQDDPAPMCDVYAGPDPDEDMQPPVPDIPAPVYAGPEPPVSQIFMATYEGPAFQRGAGAFVVPAPTPNTGGGRFCPDCGTPAKPGAKFCESCGRRLVP